MNNEGGFLRFEFLECLCRVGIAKYGQGQITDSVPEALRMLFEQNITPNLKWNLNGLVSNDFRRNRLYNRKVDDLLLQHATILKALYSRWGCSCIIVNTDVV